MKGTNRNKLTASTGLPLSKSDVPAVSISATMYHDLFTSLHPFRRRAATDINAARAPAPSRQHTSEKLINMFIPRTVLLVTELSKSPELCRFA